MSNWTKDANGNYVDWLDPRLHKPPFLSLVLPGEQYHKLDLVVRQQRIQEYYKLLERRTGLKRNGSKD